MFGLGPPELLVIFIIVLILFGGKRLPELGRALGKSIRAYKSASTVDEEKDPAAINTGHDDEASSPLGPSPDNEKDFLADKIERIPGVKEVQDIKETASKIKAASRFFLKK